MQQRKLYTKNLIFTTATGACDGVAVQTSDLLFAGLDRFVPAYRLLHSSVREDGRTIAMTKSGLIVSVCFFLASGCALFDGSEMTSGEPAVATPVAENETTASDASIQTSPAETTVTSGRSFTREEVRAMQVRLHDVGLDAGPVDGLPGAKTKAAFAKFQNGCSKVISLLKDSFEGAAQDAELNQIQVKVPSRLETQTIQTQLHDAGFNPGPIDGILGHKTRAVLAQLKAGCPIVNDFARMLEQQALASQVPESNSAKLQSVSSAGRSDVSKQALARSREDIRILQLRLRDAGFDPGPFDGVMGPKTRAAWAQYQLTQRENSAKVPVITGIRHY
jgi:peptidoglycan hydrolase-like protein with peptidoglycan-binding domain